VRRRVILYNPKAVFWTMPLAMVAVGSALDRDRYDVVIVDGRLDPDPVGTILAMLADDGPDLQTVCMGVTILTGAPIRDALKVTRGVKRAHPRLPVVWGGWHPSLFPRECLEEPGVDVSVSGQGEATFVEVVDRLAEGGLDASLSGVQGIAHRVNGQVVQECGRELVDMNRFPTHRYEMIDVERFFQIKGKRQLDYISSQGCRFRCTFCADPQVYNRGWYGYEPERMGEEFEHLWKRYRFDDLNFQDETYFTHKPRVAAVCEEIIRRGLKFSWAATMRADQGMRMEEDLWALVARSGLRRLLIGVESGSQEMMNWLRKDIKLEQVFACAEKCIKHGIAVQFPFIVGFPDETESSVAATLDVVKKLRAMSPTFEVAIFFYQPYPGSPIADLAWQKGYPQPRTLDEWAAFDFVGARGPWVTQEKWERIQNFKFYQRYGFNKAKLNPLTWPLRWLSRARLDNDFYDFPLEKAVVDLLRPQERVS
jgi:radical SAM superfamily enzyme YgiQ (UPF0313 family)